LASTLLSQPRAIGPFNSVRLASATSPEREPALHGTLSTSQIGSREEPGWIEPQLRFRGALKLFGYNDRMSGGQILIVLGAISLVVGLMIVGWRQRPMLELPPRRSIARPPEEISRLPKSERAEIARLARLGLPIDDGAVAPIVAAYCRWRIEAFDRTSWRNGPLWQQLFWVIRILMYPALAILFVAQGIPWLILMILPGLALRVGFVTGVIPKLWARPYLRTAEANGWIGRGGRQKPRSASAVGE